MSEARTSAFTADEAVALAMRNLRRTEPSEETLKLVAQIEGEVHNRAAASADDTTPRRQRQRGSKAASHRRRKR